MVAGLMSTAANVALNALFVFGFGLGLFGIALATVLSRLAGLGYAMRRAQALEARRRREPWPPPAPRAWPPPTRLILTLALPGGLTYLLAAVEGSVINAVLAGLPNSTDAIASWGVYERMLSLAIMPAVATSVAVVPYVARLLPTADAHRIRPELGQTLAWVLGAALALTAALGWVWAAPLASFFIDSDSGGASPLTLGALRLLPFGALALAPFHMLRPVCEAAQRPQLGVLLALARYVALSLPCVLAGRHLAPALGYEGLHGLIAGFVAAAALASAATLAAVHKLAPRAAPPSAR
jgi:Na+-driven multidrug efflux pump